MLLPINGLVESPHSYTTFHIKFEIPSWISNSKSREAKPDFASFMVFAICFITVVYLCRTK